MDIPGYRIKRKIGEGGMASVFLAVQESLGRELVLKILKKFDYPGQARRFLDEGRILASLNHQNIITIHDIGVFEEHHFIAMEYLQGGSLEDRIGAGLSPSAALDLLEQIGSCLDFVHRRGIIHRDVKPGNILYHLDGTAKLTDFGIAKQLEGDQDRTLDGRAFGSPYYLSPEQAQNRPLDGRTDIYALGIVFYEMLVGCKPYAADSHVQTILAHLQQPIPLLPEEYEPYQDLLQRMIAKDPDDRFGSAGELVGFVKAVRLYVDGSVTGAIRRTVSVGNRAAGSAEPEPAGPRRHSLVLQLGLGMALLSVATGGAWLMQNQQEQAAGISVEKVAMIPKQASKVAADSLDDSSTDQPAVQLEGVSMGTNLSPDPVNSPPAESGAEPTEPAMPAELIAETQFAPPVREALPKAEFSTVDALETQAQSQPTAPIQNHQDSVQDVEPAPNADVVTEDRRQPEIYPVERDNELPHPDLVAGESTIFEMQPDPLAPSEQTSDEGEPDSVPQVTRGLSIVSGTAQDVPPPAQPTVDAMAEAVSMEADSSPPAPELVAILDETKASAEVAVDTSPSEARQNLADQPEADATDVEPALGQWLLAAQQAEKEYRLTLPVNNSALYYYRKVLGHDANHRQARRGIDGIVNRYVGMAQQALKESNLEQARRYLDRGFKVRRKDTRLVALDAQWQTRVREAELAELAQRQAAETPPEAPVEIIQTPSPEINVDASTPSILDWDG